MATPIDHSELTMSGRKLTIDRVRNLEKRLEKRPDDLRARFQLMGYYCFKQGDQGPIDRARARLTLWLIDNAPECAILGEPWATIDRHIDQKSYEETKQHWLIQLERHGSDVAVIGNAAQYFDLSEPELSESLFRQVIDLEPQKPDWPKYLAWHLRRAGQSRAQDALAAIQMAVDREFDECGRYYMYDDLAEIAFDAGDLELAAGAAQRCLSMVFSFGDNWNDGNAIHNGNSVLGRIALKHGDKNMAKQYLALAGATPGSPQLNSFGPNMVLAKELLFAGENEAVIAYLEACKKFWDPRCEGGRLAEWIVQINKGEVPALR